MSSTRKKALGSTPRLGGGASSAANSARGPGRPQSPSRTVAPPDVVVGAEGRGVGIVSHKDRGAAWTPPRGLKLPESSPTPFYIAEVDPALLAIQGWGALLAYEGDLDDPPWSLDLVPRSDEPLTAGRHALAQVVVEYITLVKTGPTLDEYKRFLLGKLVPAHNAVNPRYPRCTRCGAVFRFRDRPTCSPRCDARERMEGRDKVGGGRSAAERAAIKMGMRFKNHVDKCKKGCSDSHLCSTGNKYLIAATTDLADRVDFLSRGRNRKGKARRTE